MVNLSEHLTKTFGTRLCPFDPFFCPHELDKSEMIRDENRDRNDENYYPFFIRLYQIDEYKSKPLP